jgi:3-methyl-2-oxobutanoate hydroxymethyltransferase
VKRYEELAGKISAAAAAYAAEVRDRSFPGHEQTYRAP